MVQITVFVCVCVLFLAEKARKILATAAINIMNFSLSYYEDAA